MRVIMSFALAIAGFALATTSSAEAAHGWRCIGAAFVCSAPKAKVAAKRTYKKKYGTKRSYKKKYKVRKAKRGKYKKKYAYKAKSYKKNTKRRYAKKKSKKKYYGGGRLNGIASYYWQPQRVASGGWFNPNALTAAHKTLPFGTRVRVTNKRNGKSVVVRINDRGPYIKGRIIDLSRRAAGVIGMRGAGIAPVSVTVLGRG